MVSLDESIKGLEDKTFGSEEAIAKAITALLSFEKRNLQLSELSEDEIRSLVYLRLLAKILKSKVLESFIDDYLLLKTSKDGKRAKQIVLIASRAGEFEPMRIGGKKIKDLIPGFG